MSTEVNVVVARVGAYRVVVKFGLIDEEGKDVGGTYPTAQKAVEEGIARTTQANLRDRITRDQVTSQRLADAIEERRG